VACNSLRCGGAEFREIVAGWVKITTVFFLASLCPGGGPKIIQISNFKLILGQEGRKGDFLPPIIRDKVFGLGDLGTSAGVAEEEGLQSEGGGGGASFPGHSGYHENWKNLGGQQIFVGWFLLGPGSLAVNKE